VARPKRLTEDQRLLWKAYRDLFQGLSSALQEQLHRDTALSGSEYAVLAALSHSPGGVLRARELGAELGWDRSRLSHLVRRMEQRGLVTREECADDARGSMVRLTDAGAAAVEDAAPEHSEAIRRYFFNPLSSEELATLSRVFGRLLDNLAPRATAAETR
jgi:DNA-binding MarR family transcriptional regulator